MLRFVAAYPRICIGEKKVTTGSGGATSGITVEDIEAVKKLVDRMGGEKVRQLAHVLAK